MSLSTDGVYLLNKRKGFTSSQEIQRFRKLFSIKKAGHAGTLDKFATGLLIAATGKYTKILEMMLKLDKVYDFTVDFSYLNETLDIYGRETRYLDISINEPLLKRKITEFTGEIKQRPPLYSAIKVNGKRLSDLARQQIVQDDLQVRERLVKIYNLRLLEFNKDKARLMVHCSSGTYIRSLGRDLGQKMNAGGVITSLCRRRIGPWSLKKALSLDILNENPEDLSFCRVGDFDLGCLGTRVVVSSEDILNLQKGIHPKEYQKASILRQGSAHVLTGLGNTKSSHIELVQLHGLLPSLHLGIRARHINSCRPKGPKSIANSIYIKDESERVKIGTVNNIFMYNSDKKLMAIGKNPLSNEKNQKKVCQKEPITKLKVLI